jgi:hypothetical protein
MLFTIDSDDILNDYFNLSSQKNYKLENDLKSNVVSPKEGLILGNMFANEYYGYKNYKPCEIKASCKQEADLLKIRELSFAVNDLNLMLDIQPNNCEYFRLFKIYASKLNELVKKYSDDYDVLELNQDLKNEYTWFKNPWPWEGDKYV